MEKLAILGGAPAVRTDPGDIFKWPIITEEDEAAALDVLRRGAMSGTDVTVEFERDFAEWHDVKYALGHNTGTASLHTAMFGCGLGVGDEIICQSMTFWASVLQAMNLGATIVFADMDPATLTLDPDDVERKITPQTKVIMVVHYMGYPTDMDPIMEMANARGIKVIEDVSHAHGARYKGQLVGTIGHVGAMSCMSGKALAIGEAGMLVTDDQEIYERAIAFGHYERTRQIEHPELRELAGLPLGGFKYRMNQLSSAVGRVQLKHYQERMEEIQRAMNYFWDLLEGAPGLQAHRPSPDSDSTMGGWYAPHGLYVPEELGGLSVEDFCAAVRAEGAGTSPGANLLLHRHPVLNEADVYGHGTPTRIAHADRDVRQGADTLPKTDSLPERVYSIPWFKHYRPEIIREHAAAFRKVVAQAGALLDRS
jgi:dTDP-4-amino-4,6-dideoxygalactose transaminase